MSPDIQPGPYGRIPFCREVVVVDTETTGLSRDADRICSLGAVRLIKGRDNAWRQVGTLHVLLDPVIPVGEKASAVNGFWRGPGNEIPEGKTDLAGLPVFADEAKTIDSFLTSTALLVAHNAMFDFGFIAAEMRRGGIEARAMYPTVCTKNSFNKILGVQKAPGYVPQSNLNALCDLLGVNRDGRVNTEGVEAVHTALYDAQLAAECFSILEPLGWCKVEFLPTAEAAVKAGVA